jgi:hypothetical protein
MREGLRGSPLKGEEAKKVGSSPWKEEEWDRLHWKEEGEKWGTMFFISCFRRAERHDMNFGRRGLRQLI